MATPAEILSLRKITDGGGEYTDAELGAMLDASSERKAAYRIWNEKAASYASLVNVSESGSSRNLSELHKNALTMAAVYSPQTADAEAEVIAPKRTRRMVRG